MSGVGHFGAAVLAGGAMLLAAITIATSRRSAVPIADFPGFRRRWSGLHGGYDPATSVFVNGWLRIAYAAARPLAGWGVKPNLITAWGLLVSAAAVPLAAPGTRWPLLAALTVILAGLVDSLDGTVAVLTDRATRFGYVLDSVVDRLSDAAFLLALWRLGAPPQVCVAAGTALGLLEYTRARAGNAGMGEIGVVTVGERGTRIPLVAATLGTAGLYPESAAGIATLGAVTTAGLSAIGLGQLLVVARRLLR